jgi:hypothetical protein
MPEWRCKNGNSGIGGSDMVRLATETKAADPGLWSDGGCTMAEAAAFTSLSLRTLKARIQDGSVPVSRIGRRVVIPRRYLTNLLTATTTGGK